MKYCLPAILFSFFSLFSPAQLPVKDPWAKLATYHISATDLLVNLQLPDSDYSFHYAVTTGSPEGSSVINAVFNPMLMPGWMLDTSVKKDSHVQQKLLNKRVKLMATATPHITKSSFQGGILSYYFIVTFMVDSTDLPPLYNYLKDCKATAYINMTKKSLEKISWENFRGTRMGNVSVSSVHLDVFPELINGKYRVVKEWYEMRGRTKTELHDYQETVIYSGYKRL
jgi:hypothetical protein